MFTKILKALISVSTTGKHKDVTFNADTPSKPTGKGLRVDIAPGTALPSNLEADCASIGWGVIYNQFPTVYNGKMQSASIVIGAEECFGSASSDSTDLDISDYGVSSS
jgi:hypothetical protein